ncbi:HAD-IC family P-type ATPase [Ktedonobacter sp. SOSP1-85]|uniref:HAD-IC family P-type ATPase n=1 Tax=Ktedonobacter sp. SOSP1-85 TaxID=2778367 RepID=UPI001F31D99B|nr:HAD-IC family P-type ATPase [Ktedonobacter sp. SOSP1-85]
MSVAVVGEPLILHTLPGRMRVHLPGWSKQERRVAKARLRQMQGVQRVQDNELTGNVLIQFDATVTDEQTILEAVSQLELAQIHIVEAEEAAPRSHAVTERRGRLVRTRIPVRGLERDPSLAQRVLEKLTEFPGIRAEVSLLTGRVLVEFDEHQAELDDILAAMIGLELPELPGESSPTYPLEAGPLVQSATRFLGSTLGLGMLAVRQLLGAKEELPGAETAVHVSSVIGILQGIPMVRYGLRRLIGRTAADLLVSLPSILLLSLANSPLGLAVIGSESLGHLTTTQARRQAWQRYLEHMANAPTDQPDALIHLETGERTPLAALVISGTGTGIGRDGMPFSVLQGDRIPAGVRLYGGPFALKLQGAASFDAFTPQPRPAPLTPTSYDRYQQIVGPCVLAFAGVTALLTRSLNQTLAALLLVNPRTASIGQDTADLAAYARLIRSGVTVVSTRKERMLRLPQLLLLDGVRLLMDELELGGAFPLAKAHDIAQLLAHAASVSMAAGSPWGDIFKDVNCLPAILDAFDGKVATATIDGQGYTLGPVENWSALPNTANLRQRGYYVLVLRREHGEQPLGIFALRPRLAQGIDLLVQVCQRYGVEIGILAAGDQVAVEAFAKRAHVALFNQDDAPTIIRARQQQGGVVAFVSDHAAAAEGFAACDLAIGLSDGRSRLPARADLMAGDLRAVVAIIEASACRDAAVRDAVGFSLLSNLIGVFWGLRGLPALKIASRGVHLTSLAAIAASWLRLRGGKRSRSALATLVDPHPERWGHRSIAEVLQTLQSSPSGLTVAQAEQRRRQTPVVVPSHRLLSALWEQVRSPLTGILAAGAALSLFLGATGDVFLIGGTILLNVAVGAWQQQKADQVAEALQHLDTTSVQVLRDGQAMTVDAGEIVLGDILLLSPGDRIPADARILTAQGLEVDEAALTGESLPVPKRSDGLADANHILLEGSDVTSGTGSAVVVAVGRQTRLGTLKAALAAEEEVLNPLGVRLSQILRYFLPLSLAGGALVVGAGLLWKRSLTALITTGVTVALAAIPEGLPLLARVGEAGVARRLIGHNAVVRRLSAVEALGRVDVACADKTGTMTRGRLMLTLVADMQQEASVPGELSPELRQVLSTAALASPHPDAPDMRAHPTDVAIIQGALDATLDNELYVEHSAELPFDPVRSFHLTVTRGRSCLKGAPEVLAKRCRWMLVHGEKLPVDTQKRQELLTRAQSLAERGLRVLMVAEGSNASVLEDPQDLTALGFVCISDPLRETVCPAVQRCHEAGVRVIMITGDHPSTACAIAREAGLLVDQGQVLVAKELADLSHEEVDRRLERAAVIARATPLDKLRIIEHLQRRGHVVAMTGDGVNDAPALRLADVGVAMGIGGTEVARQTADLVLTDDDFSTLVEALVEGRSFWRNIRRALGLLLGGNMGELALVVGASLLGLSTPLTASQMLAVNAITDIFPSLAVALQGPEHRRLAHLSREGTGALNRTLRFDVLRRGLATALPSLLSYLITRLTGTLPQARSVAFASVVITQLAQTLDAGRAEGTLTPSVLTAVGGSVGVLAAAFTVAPLRTFLGLALPSALGWALVGSSALVAVGLSRLLIRTEGGGQLGTASEHLV